MKSISPKSNSWNERLFNLFTYTLVLIVIISGLSLLWNWHQYVDKGWNEKISLDLRHIREIKLPTDAGESHPADVNCKLWNCLNLYRCGKSGHDRLTVYVYPIQDYVDMTSGKYAATLTREYYEILKTVVESPYYTSNPNDACLFLPSIDTLNQNLIEPLLVGRALASLDHWESGENHILFNMLSGKYPEMNRFIDVNTDRAIVLGSGFDTWSYRQGFDVSLPVWSPSLHDYDPSKFTNKIEREYLLVIAQLNIMPEQLRLYQEFSEDMHDQVLLLRACEKSPPSPSSPSASAIVQTKVRCSSGNHQRRRHTYPSVLARGKFCLLSRSLRLGQPDFLEMLAHGCIPVIAIDNYVLPFEDVIDWTLASVHIRESELHALMRHLSAISETKIFEMKRQVDWLYQRYFKDLRTITLTTLRLLEGRIFPHRAESKHHWNAAQRNYKPVNNPLFLPLIAPKSQGFTAVILTYDRVESMFSLIQNLALVPSLQSILVIWNNQKKSPPHISAYPPILKPIKVIQTKANKLSNRFYPYAEIETEAILTIDDDIIMLTADELDFGYEVWREFPDRIVGFPSRQHVWNNSTMRWHYESEWTNKISMVLTGAAFHHKFWSHMYTYSMPGNIKQWVDEHMNCEDIAMNFLVANITNKPPIKVTPRKKFKCPECTSTEMLSADLNHMRERSACIDRFARIYGRMPLRSVEFRADPVLFKDNFPDKLKRFNDVGSL